MNPRDGCARCLTPDAFVTVAPVSMRRKDGSLICTYRCSRCGYWWVTSWSLQALEELTEDFPGPGVASRGAQRSEATINAAYVTRAGEES